MRAVMLLLGGAFVVLSTTPRPALQPSPVIPAERDGSPGADSHQDASFRARTKGFPEAPVTVFEVADFQCPACRTFWEETLPELEREYVATGRIKLVFVNFPLVQIHPNATPAHEFAMCAAEQDRFWTVHDLLYRHQRRWAELEEPSVYFTLLADSASLDRERLGECLAAGGVRQVVQEEAEASWRNGIRSTPSFVVEGALISGAAPIDQWRPVLDSIYRVKSGT